MACVYALSSSLDPNVVRYVGRSKADCGKSRLEHHLWETRRGTRSHKCNWINSVQSAGGKIVSTVLESGLTWGESTMREVFFIAHYRDMGSLTNMTDGGEGAVGAIPSSVTRAKMSAALKGRPLSAEHRAALSAATKGKKRKPHSAEARANMVVAQRKRRL